MQLGSKLTLDKAVIVARNSEAVKLQQVRLCGDEKKKTQGRVSRRFPRPDDFEDFSAAATFSKLLLLHH